MSLYCCIRPFEGNKEMLIANMSAISILHPSIFPTFLLNASHLPLLKWSNLKRLFKGPKVFLLVGQVSAWQSATLLPISYKSVQSAPARVEEPVCLVKQSSSGGVTNNPARGSRLLKLS